MHKCYTFSKSKSYKGKWSRGRLERRWRDELDDYHLSEDSTTQADVKQHAVVFVRPRDTTAAQRWRHDDNEMLLRQCGSSLFLYGWQQHNTFTDYSSLVRHTAAKLLYHVKSIQLGGHGSSYEGAVLSIGVPLCCYLQGASCVVETVKSLMP